MRWRHRRGRAWRVADQNLGEKRRGDGKVSLESIRRTAIVGFGVPRRGRVGASCDRQKVPVLTDCVQTLEGRGSPGVFYRGPRVHNGKPGLVQSRVHNGSPG